MPLPMVHFVIAVEMHKLQDRTPSPGFILGSIAPDAIHARPNTGRPDKNRTHLLQRPHSQTTDEEFMTLVRAFLLRHWEQKNRPGAEAAHLDFMEGYAAHVLADRLWLDWLFRPFQSRLAHLAPEEISRLYYREVGQIDVHLHRRMVWQPQIWQALEAATALDVEDLLIAQEVDAWRHNTLTWYDDPQNNPQIEPSYITYNAVVDFATEVAKKIPKQFAEWKEA